MKIILLFFAVSSAILVSCGQEGTSSFAQKEEIIVKYVTNSAFHHVEVLSIELNHDITAADSLSLYLNEYGQGINDAYDKMVNDINAVLRLKKKAEDHLNFGGDGSKSYYQNQVNEYSSELKRKTEELNGYVDASEGKSAGTKWEYLFQPIERLNKMSSDKIVGKVYKVELKYMQDTYRERRKITTPVNKTAYFLFNPDETKIAKQLDDFSKPNSPVVKIGPFSRIEQNNLTEESTSENQIVKFVSSEFTGACIVIFKTPDGKELKFINPKLDSYEDVSGCGVKESLQNKSFSISFKTGQVNYYIEDVGDITEKGLILTSIQIK